MVTIADTIVCYENSSWWVAGGKWRSAGILSVILLPRMSNEPMQQLKLHLCMLSSNWQRLQDDQYMCITVLAPPTLTGVIIVKIVSYTRFYGIIQFKHAHIRVIPVLWLFPLRNFCSTIVVVMFASRTNVLWPVTTNIFCQAMNL